MNPIPILVATLFLSGCTHYAETFDCGAGQGVGCKSLSYVNAEVERGRLPFETEDDKSVVKGAVNPPPPHSGTKIWIAGYKDPQGFYHEPSYVRLR